MKIRGQWFKSIPCHKLKITMEFQQLLNEPLFWIVSIVIVILVAALIAALQKYNKPQFIQAKISLYKKVLLCKRSISITR